MVGHYGDGVATVDTDRTQGAAGLLGGAGPIQLADVTIHMRNEYGSITITSLDGEPIESSKSLLIQAMTEDQPYGFRRQDGKIVALGSAPFGVRKIDAHVLLPTRYRSFEVVALDENGYALDRSAFLESDRDGALVLQLPTDPLYTVLRAGVPAD